MTELTVVRNDPNRALRDRMDPEERASSSAQAALTLVLSDLHEAARTRLDAQSPTRRRGRRHR
jgi:hypothetical protein